MRPPRRTTVNGELAGAPRWCVAAVVVVALSAGSAAAAPVPSAAGSDARGTSGRVSDDALVAPTEADLQGRWVEGADPARWLEVRGLSWVQGVGGCNTWSRGFRLTERGRFAFSGPESTTEMGCVGDDVGWAVIGVARLGLDGAVLVLLDGEGDQLARLTPTDENA